MMGGILAAISVFMPWYQDLDRFNTGFEFYGITGPLYLVGLFFLATGIVILGSLFVSRVRDRIKKMGFQLSHFYSLSAGFLAFLFVLTNSVYFHENFGVNITEKSFRFGMIFAVLGIFSLFMGSVFLARERPKTMSHDLFGESLDEVLAQRPSREHQTLTEMPHEKSATEQGKIDL